MKDHTSKNNNTTTVQLKVVVYSSIIALLVMIVTAGLVFFISVTPRDLLSMPKVTGLHITDALLLLQSYDLYGKIEPRFTKTSENVDLVLEQKPAHSVWVRGNRIVNLIVSRGKSLDTIPDFRGKTLDELKKMLITSFSNNLLHIREPLLYAFDDTPRGTIIGQQPTHGTKLLQNTPLELIISRGSNPEKSDITENYLGVSFDKVVHQLAKKNIPFRFIAVDKFDSFPKVVEQSPKPGSHFTVNQEMLIKISQPSSESLDPNHVFGIFSFDIPVFDTLPVVEVILISSMPDSQQTLLLTTSQQGVNLSLPYIGPHKSQIVVKINKSNQITYLIP